MHKTSIIKEVTYYVCATRFDDLKIVTEKRERMFVKQGEEEMKESMEL